MSQGITIQGKTTADKNVPVLVTDLGEVNIARIQDLVDAINTTVRKVEGTVAAGATDSGNPVKVGGKYNLTQPTYADGQRGDAQIDSRGNLKATLMPFNSNTAMKNATDNADGVAVSATSNWLGVLNRNTVFNGVSWDRLRGDSTSGMWVNIKSPAKPNLAYELVQYDDSTSPTYEYYLYSDKDANFYIKRVTTSNNYTEFKSGVTPTTGSGFYAWASALTSWQTYDSAF